jgi:hypothetical protein
MSAEGAAPHFQTPFNPELTLGAISCRPFGPENIIQMSIHF